MIHVNVMAHRVSQLKKKFESQSAAAAAAALSAAAEANKAVVA